MCLNVSAYIQWSLNTSPTRPASLGIGVAQGFRKERDAPSALRRSVEPPEERVTQTRLRLAREGVSLVRVDIEENVGFERGDGVDTVLDTDRSVVSSVEDSGGNAETFFDIGEVVRFEVVEEVVGDAAEAARRAGAHLSVPLERLRVRHRCARTDSLDARLVDSNVEDDLSAEARTEKDARRRLEVADDTAHVGDTSREGLFSEREVGLAAAAVVETDGVVTLGDSALAPPDVASVLVAHEAVGEDEPAVRPWIRGGQRRVRRRLPRWCVSWTYVNCGGGAR